MNRILEIKRTSGRTVAIILDLNKDYRISFVESNSLQQSLSSILKNGIKVNIPRGREYIEINTSPKDADFLEDLGRFLQLSFDFYFVVTKLDFDQLSILYHSHSFPYGCVNEWQVHQPDHSQWLFLQPKQKIEFRIESEYKSVIIQNTSNWFK